MTIYILIISYWLVAGITALIFTIRKVVIARITGDVSKDESTFNAAQRYQARWRLRSAYMALAASIAFAASPITNILSLGSGWTILALSLGFTLFVLKQVDDDRAHDALADMITTEPSGTHQRHMDQEQGS